MFVSLNIIIELYCVMSVVDIPRFNAVSSLSPVSIHTLIDAHINAWIVFGTCNNKYSLKHEVLKTKML